MVVASLHKKAKKLKKFIFIIVGGFVIYKVVQSMQQGVNQTINSLVFTPSGVQIDTSNYLNPQIKVNILINNPATLSFTIQSFFATITDNENTILGTINLNTPTTINAGSSQTLSLPISLQGTAILNTILSGSILNIKSITIDGYYYVNGLKQLYNQVYSLPANLSA